MSLLMRPRRSSRLWKKGARTDDAASAHLLSMVQDLNVLSVHWLTLAAERRDERACFRLGTWHRDGCMGLPVDVQLAADWFRKMPFCSFKDADQDMRKEAAAFVRLHPD